MSDQQLADAACGVLDRLYAAQLAQVRDLFRDTRLAGARGAARPI